MKNKHNDLDLYAWLKRLNPDPEIVAMQQASKRLAYFQIGIMIVLAIIIPDFPDPTRAWTIWLDQILPHSIWSSPYFPLTSKVMLNYLAISSLLLGLLFYRYHADALKQNMILMRKTEKPSLKQTYLVILGAVMFLLLYFSPYFADFSVNTIEEAKAAAMRRGQRYPYRASYDYLLIFTFIHGVFSWLMLMFVATLPIKLAEIFTALFVVKSEE